MCEGEMGRFWGRILPTDEIINKPRILSVAESPRNRSTRPEKERQYAEPHDLFDNIFLTDQLLRLP
jgi:hypothetical protein